MAMISMTIVYKSNDHWIYFEKILTRYKEIFVQPKERPCLFKYFPLYILRKNALHL